MTEERHANLEVLVHTRLNNGKHMIQGICGNGEDAGKTHTIRSSKSAQITAELEAAVKQLQSACQKKPITEETIAFPNLDKSTIAVTENSKGQPTIVEYRWQCSASEGKEPERYADYDYASGLPSFKDLKAKGKEMADRCSMKIQEASARR